VASELTQPTPIYEQLCFERDSGGVITARHRSENDTPNDHPATSPGQHHYRPEP
jgi:hypothetical protein